MRIGELSARTGVSISRIRFYEKRGVLPQPTRDANGYRSYAEDAVDVLNFLTSAQALGFSLAEIRAGFTEAGTTLPSGAPLVKALQQKMEEIDEFLKAASEKKHAIALLLDQLKCIGQASGC